MVLKTELPHLTPVTLDVPFVLEGLFSDAVLEDQPCEGECDANTDPLTDFSLVPLWQDVNVRLQGTGIDNSSVPVIHTRTHTHTHAHTHTHTRAHTL